MFTQTLVLITSAFMSSTWAADCRRKYCSPDKDETWYCCGFKHQCCYREKDAKNAKPATDFWWFWFLFFLFLVLVVALIVCLCFRYACYCLRGAYCAVPRESRSVIVQVRKPSTNVLSNHGCHNHGHSSNPVTASAPPLHDQPPHGHLPPLHGQPLPLHGQPPIGYPPHDQLPHGHSPPPYGQPLLPSYQTISLIETHIS